jgi:8-oxo-dGTP pyrophosphatase MutT (NUDIX family)
MKTIATVAIQHNENPDLYLYGRRRDNFRWTIPGGHCEKEETPLQGAVREALEEVGIHLTPDQLTHVDSVQINVDTPRHCDVHLFKAVAPPGVVLDISNDPDSEFQELRYLDPRTIAEQDRHVAADRDLLLRHINQQDAELGVNELNKAIHTPSKFTNYKQLEQIKRDHNVGAKGKEYDEQSLNESIIDRKVADAERMVREADKMQRRPMKKKDLIPGGLAAGTTNSDFPKKKIKQGEKVELEHTSSKPIADEIVRDHLTEDPAYYKKLKTIETKKAEPLMKPYRSEAQRRWAHTMKGKAALGGKAKVAHWDKESKGLDLPEKVDKAELKKALSPEELNAQGYKFKIFNPTKSRDNFAVRAYHGNKAVGHLVFSSNANSSPENSDGSAQRGYHSVSNGHISEDHRGKGLYQHMINMAGKHTKSIGSKGVYTSGSQRSKAATNAWQKVASHATRNPYTFKDRPTTEDNADFYLAASELQKDQPVIGLPKVKALPTRTDQEVHTVPTTFDRKDKLGQTTRKRLASVLNNKRVQVIKEQLGLTPEQALDASKKSLKPKGLVEKVRRGSNLGSVVATKITGSPMMANSSTAMVREGQNSSTLRHEAAHLLLHNVEQKYGPEARKKVVSHVLHHFHPDDQSALISYILKRGYKSNSPAFKEEAMNAARDILTNPEARDSLGHMGLKPDLNRMKAAWKNGVSSLKDKDEEWLRAPQDETEKQRAMASAAKLTPQDPTKVKQNPAEKLGWKKLVASELQKANELPQLPQVKINPEHSKIIANAYGQMKHDPNHPDVKAAYGALTHETGNQFKDLLSQGYKFSKIQPGQENPYKTSKDMHSDIATNKHLWYFPTEQGYGSGDQGIDHPLLQESDFSHGGKQLLHNDIFRIVHDINGHHLGGQSGFGPKGEHQAFLQHKKMYSPLAQKALASETMGQNSYVNAGPNAEHNKKNPAQTIYAEQKAGLLPEHIINGKWHE